MSLAKIAEISSKSAKPTVKVLTETATTGAAVSIFSSCEKEENIDPFKRKREILNLIQTYEENQITRTMLDDLNYLEDQLKLCNDYNRQYQLVFMAHDILHVCQLPKNKQDEFFAWYKKHKPANFGNNDKTYQFVTDDLTMKTTQMIGEYRYNQHILDSKLLQ